MSLRLVAVAVLVSPLPMFAGEPSGEPDQSPEVFRDEFDGKLSLDWKPLRPDPTHYSLDSRPGALTITTQRGSIHGDEFRDTNSGGLRPKNLFLIDNPLPADADFAMTTRITDFTPFAKYHQAGLLIHEDDGRYVKLEYGFNWRHNKPAFLLVREMDSVPTHSQSQPHPDLKECWLRLTRRGEKYEAAFSLDGKTFETLATERWTGKPVRVGLIAKNGGVVAPEIDAHFEFFELRVLEEEIRP